MKKIFKYPIEINDEVSIGLPEGAEILSFQLQGGCPNLWVLVDENADVELRRFRVYGTGHRVENGDKLNYIGTIVGHMGQFVWHLFEETKEAV